MRIPFVKMHGLGNDFVLIDCRVSGHPDVSGIAGRLCDRRFGIGADQLLLLSPSDNADFRMRIFNSDGSEVEMCGNGIRCLARYVWDRGLSKKQAFTVETLAGIITPEQAGSLIRVNMGEPVFAPEKIPVNIREMNRETKQQGRIIGYPLSVEDREFRITGISMGNPHAVIFVDNVSSFPVALYGKMIESHRLFPKRTNVEFVEILDSLSVKMRVWERGAGETLACGTGASAAAVAAHLNGLTGRTVTVKLAGGNLLIEWASDNHVYMSGPAVEVFEGSIDLDSLGATV